MKMRVLIIRNAAFNDFGGGERFPVFLAESLKKNGFDSIIVSRSQKLLKYAKLRSLKTIKGLWWQKQNWSGKFALLFPVYLVWQIILFVWYFLIFIKFNPKVIHVQSKDDFIAATLAGKMLCKRVIWTDHADLKHIWKNVRIWYKNPIGKLILVSAYLANQIVVISNNEMKLIRNNLGLCPLINKKMKLIYNGAHDEMKSYKITRNKKFTFIYAGRLVIDKGVGEIIAAFNKLGKEKNDIQLQIVGDGPDTNKFKNLAKANKNIYFLGHKSDPYSDMINADVFIYASYHEAFGISLVEASMLELPIIATKVGGIPEIIEDDVTGLLINPKDSESLYVAMKKIYENKNLSKKLSKNARFQFEKKFNFDYIVKDQYIPLYLGERR